jgi:GNAT superfamily N-acetyltransferase
VAAGPVVRPYVAGDAAWAAGVLDPIGGRVQARRDELIDVLEPGTGFIAEHDGRPVGLLTYRLEAEAVELTAVVAEPRGIGTGSALVSALWAAGVAAGRPRIWVVTTNDNLDALRFYQRRGFGIVAVRPGAVDRARAELKPGIGRIGAHGIPIRDEIELVLDHDPAT